MSGWLSRVDGFRGQVGFQMDGCRGRMCFQGGASPAPTIFGIQIPRIVVACDDNNPPLP
jgi:hypothetical protein